MKRRIVIIAVTINLITMQANLRLKDEELRKANILIDELEVFRFNHHVLARFCPKCRQNN